MKRTVSNVDFESVLYSLKLLSAIKRKNKVWKTVYKLKIITLKANITAK